MALSRPLIRFTLQGTTLGQRTINTFFYRILDEITQPLNAYANAFEDALEPVLTLVTTGAATFETLELAEVLQNGLVGRVFQTSLGWFGTVTGDALPPYAAWAFQLLVANRVAGERNGAKRFSGVPEIFQAEGLANAAALIALGDLAFMLQDTIPVGGETMVPVVVTRVPGSDPVVYDNDRGVSSAIYSSLSTQNSRKFGVGV
jgi:hypothetical protein